MIHEQKWCNKYNEKFWFEWKNWITIKFFIIYKIGETTYYKKKNRRIILNRAKDYYENNKEKKRKIREKY